MSGFELEPADILANVNDKKTPYASLKRWLGIHYDHVFMYMGRLGILKPPGFSVSELLSVPMLFESSGRGVVMASLSNRYGQPVVVMRLISEHDRRRVTFILKEAIKLASNPQSYYDYFTIMRWVIPRILREKFNLPLPVAWHRDALQICSEAVFEVFDRAGIREIVRPHCIPPLPGDFVDDSAIIERVWEGKLSGNLVRSQGEEL